MAKKKLLVDLSILRHPMCGLGQIALNYGRWFAQHAPELADRLDITLLVPKNFEGAFGNDVHYLRRTSLRHLIPALIPHFDLWHAISPNTLFHPVGRSTRVILTIHDVNFVHEKSPEKQAKYRRKLQRWCDRATELAFISRFAQQDAARVLDFGDKPQRIIYNGVEDLTQGPRQEPNHQSSLITHRFFLSLGEVKEKKNLHVLLPMMERLPDHHLIIAGNDNTDYAKHLASLISQLSTHNVHILGMVSDEERRWLYAHCEGLLMPSVAEGFGLPVIEAMQWGKPVFCSDRTSLPEVGGPYAHYFSTFEPESMAAVVRQGLAEHNGKKAAQEQSYAASFSYDRHMQQYVDRYLANCL